METRLVGVAGERQQREELIDYYSIEVEMKVTQAGLVAVEVNEEKQLDSQYILKIELTRLANGLNVGV